jgi:hypothetical protein
VAIRHAAAGRFVDDDDFAIFDEIVLVEAKLVMSL